MIAQIAPSGTARSNQAAPYFERNNFIEEEVAACELKTIHNFGMTDINREDLLEIKTALNVIGYSPASKLINSMAENDILALALSDLVEHPHTNFLLSLLPKLKKEGGATHLALVLPRTMQKMLDVFVLTGQIFPTLCPVNLSDYGLSAGGSLLPLLHSARLAGYQISAIGPDMKVLAFDPEYEQKLAIRLMTILQVEAKAKIIFLAADKHLSNLPIGDWLSVCGLLKNEGVKIQTVNQLWHGKFMPKMAAALLYGLSRSICLAAKDMKTFAALQGKSLPFEQIFSPNWDLTIIYPQLSVAGRKPCKSSLNAVGVALYRFLWRMAVS